MADPLSSWAGGLAAKHGPIAAGLLIGTLAKYGLTIGEGKRLTWRSVLADLLLQGALGLIAIAISDVFGLTGNARVFVGALAALNSERLVRLARDRFIDKVESDLAATVKAAPSTAVKVPAGSGEPDAIEAEASVEDRPDARAGAALRAGFRRAVRQSPPDDQIELLRRLDRESGT